MVGGLTIFGLAARLYDPSGKGQPPHNVNRLAALGQEAIAAFLFDERVLGRW
jgi:hypothetical protein